MNRIARLGFGGPPPVPAHPAIPDLNDPNLGVILTATDIVVHWICPGFINYVTFNGIFGAVTAWHSTTRRDSNASS